MCKSIAIQLKAAFLLIIFGFNMMAGFACAIGVDLGFNKTHHQDEKATQVHVHANGKKHHHKKQEQKHNESKQKDDCCNDKVMKISQTDKAVPQVAKLLGSVFFMTFVSTYYNINITYPSQVTASTKYFVRGHHPPIPDIRIAIHRFQI